MKKTVIILFFLPLFVFSACGKCDSLKFMINTVALETDSGMIRLAFFEDSAPIHVKNFKKLIDTGFYKGKPFHRIVPDFVIQAGRDTTMAEKMISPEISKIHFRGALAAARTADDVNPEMKSDAYEFYICLKPLPQLDGKYTVFGRTVEGFNTIKKISLCPRDPEDKPLEEIIIRKAYFETYFDSEKFEYYKHKTEIIK